MIRSVLPLALLCCFVIISGFCLPPSRLNTHHHTILHKYEDVKHEENTLGWPAQIKTQTQAEDSYDEILLTQQVQHSTKNLAPIKNFVDQLTFQWVDELLKLGNKKNKTLHMEDLWTIHKKELSYYQSILFQNIFTNELKESKQIEKKENILQSYWNSPLSKTILKMYHKEFLSSGVLKLINTVVQFIPSLIVARILKLTNIPHAAITFKKILKNEGILLSFLLFITLCSKTIIENQYFDVVINLGARIKSTLSSAIYRKSLQLSPTGRKNNTVGEIVTYMQIDSNRLETVASSIHTLWDGILQVTGYTGLLLYFLGPSVFAGIACMLVILPLNAMLLKKLSALRSINLKLTDSRVKLTNEILQNVRTIKSYNWEKHFLNKLNEARQKELDSLKASANTRAILVSALSAAPSFVAVCTLSVYAMLGNVLDAPKVFTALALFNQLRFPLIFFPTLLNSLAEGKVSLDRVTNFLLTDEVQNYVIKDRLLVNQTSNDRPIDNDIAIRIQNNGVFSWSNDAKDIQGSTQQTAPIMIVSEEQDTTNSKQSKNTSYSRGILRKCDISIRKGELVAVIGPIGTGKTTLLNAILGELNKVEGSVFMDGRVAYVSQTSWIPNETVRNVVLFGKKLEMDKYQEIIKSCGLTRDLELLEAGDQTEIGERGVNLSGGQKQRLAIARAVYDDADVYLLDDPLSALDAEVGAEVFRECIKGSLDGKTRILVTHQLKILPEVDKILIMGIDPTNGSCTIVDQGTFFQLQKRGYDLSKLVNNPVEEGSDEVKKPVPVEIESQLVEEHTSLPEEVMSTPGELATEEGPLNNEQSVLASQELFINTIPPTGGLLDGCSSPDCHYDGCDITDDLLQPQPLLNNPIDNVYTETNFSTTSHLSMNDTHTGTGFNRLDVSNSMPMPSIMKSEDDSSLLNGFSKASTPTALTDLKPIHEKTTDGASFPTTEHEPILDRKSTLEPKRTRKLIANEERAQGAVAWGVYESYVQAANKPLLLAKLFMSFMLANASQILQQFVVSLWTSDVGYRKWPLAAYLTLMATMAGWVAFFNWSRTYIGVQLGAAASETIHKNMLTAVLKAPLHYFESTPIGRLVQRFSKDLDQIDQQLPGAIGQLIASTLSIGASMLAIFAVTPSFGFIMIAISSVYIAITNYYRKIARELKRLESISRSPILTHFSESLGGLPIIRSFQKQSMVQRINEVQLDNNLSAYYSMKAVDRWLSIRLESLGNIIVLFSSLLAVLTGSRAGAAGLSLNNALGVTSLLNWAVRNGAETESLMNSVERVMYTTTETPSESAFIVDKWMEDKSLIPTTTSNAIEVSNDLIIAVNTSQPIQSDNELKKSGWPWAGGIMFEDIQMRYRSDVDLVLKGVSLNIAPGEKLGIVGRTGSGKSSLFRALLRLTEAEAGRVSIDGIQLSDIGLDVLRSSISIIPQDPVLFSGSIRINLDPFSEHSDEELWYALKKSNLDQTIAQLPGGLSYEVAENGDNFSAGQRQLLCLARALIRQSKVLLLDEATSSVDYETDALIQTTIREEFGQKGRRATILCIAHRLDTILDSDKILVMDSGHVVEFATPNELLQNSSSIFSQLISTEKKQKKKEMNNLLIASINTNNLESIIT